MGPFDNAMSRVYTMRAGNAGSMYDTRIGQNTVETPGQPPGYLMIGNGHFPVPDVGQSALTILALAVVGIVAFNVWTHAYQA